MPKISRDNLEENGRRAISIKGSESQKPVITNRGAAGLLRKLTDEQRARLVLPDDGDLPPIVQVTAEHRIVPALQHMAVPIDGLILDPENARQHPERNLQAIKDSLTRHGQRKNIVVNRRTMIVEAGNGTLEAAKALGWTEIATAFVDDEPLEAMGYGIADNRTAELATWNLAVVSRIGKLLRAAGQETVGWSQDELDVLRADGFIAPPEQFPEVDESLEVQHICPKCGYAFSGGQVTGISENSDGGDVR